MKLAINHKLVLIAVLALTLIACFSVSAQTIEQLSVQPEEDFVVGPGKSEVVVEPGTIEKRELRVTSRIPGTTTFSLAVEDFVGSDDPTQTVKLLGDQIGPYSLQDFIELPFDEFTLNFGERITIPITINIPADVDPGGRYGAVIVSNAPSKLSAEAQETGAVVVSRLGSLFLVRVAGEVNEEGRLADFRIGSNQKVFTSGHPGQFELLFENTGSVHLVPYGLIQIKNIFGSVVDEVPVDAYFSLPNSTRYRMVEWNNPPAMFGVYKASLNLERGYGDLVDESNLSFVIVPWQPLIIVLLAALLAIFIAIFLANKFEIKRK